MRLTKKKKMTSKVEKVAVIGAGTMGCGIAQAFAHGGCEVRITDSDSQVLASARSKIERRLDAMVLHGVLSDAEANEVRELIVPVELLSDAVGNSEFVTECVPEILELKQQIFFQIESCTPKGVVLASNTSSLSLSDIGLMVCDKSRLIITHYFNPAHILPAVEVVPARSTSPQTVARTLSLLGQIGKTPVLLRRDIPGFIVNRIQAAMVREALFLLEEQVATPAELDLAIRGSIGARLAVLGPFEVMDFGGLDVWMEVLRNLLPQLSNATFPTSLFTDNLLRGRLGAKSGHGFYEWPLSRQANKMIRSENQMIDIVRTCAMFPFSESEEASSPSRSDGETAR